MSTRATYQINGTTFYIHHDGYKEGAAAYFYRAIMADRHFLAESFLRANDRAEFTTSHSAHMDTEYRYTFEGTILKVMEASWVDGKDEWKISFEGDLAEFINMHHSMIEGYQQLFMFNNHPVTRAKVEVMIREKAAILTAALVMHPERMGNNNAMMNEVMKLSEWLADNQPA